MRYHRFFDQRDRDEAQLWEHLYNEDHRGMARYACHPRHRHPHTQTAPYHPPIPKDFT